MTRDPAPKARSPLRLAEMTWTEVDSLDRDRTVLVLPVGAVEAHGPHLPLGTDLLIAEAMAAAGASLIAEAGRLVPLLLPPLSYTPAPFAAAFPGTVSVEAGTLEETLVAIVRACSGHGFRLLAVANSHLDPAHLAALHRAVDGISADGGTTVVFPDLTRRRWATRLTDEFRSGACHAGRYEGSIVLAVDRSLVDEDTMRDLPVFPVSLSRAIRDGAESFGEIGGDRAYFGDPAAATVEEGRRTIEILGEILAAAVAEALEPLGSPPTTVPPPPGAEDGKA